MKKLFKRVQKNTAGSSLVSVMVAFIILLVGIAGFLTAIKTTTSLVTKAANLNTATGEVTEKFYQAYQTQESFAGEDGNAGYLINFTGSDGSQAFYVRGSAHTMEISASITGDGGSETIDYSMYYFK